MASRMEDTSAAILMDFEAPAEVQESRQDSLFDVQDESLESSPEESLKSADEVSLEARAAPAESAAADAEEDSEDFEDGYCIELEVPTAGQSGVSPVEPLRGHRADAMAHQLVETLKAANGPPESGNPHGQRTAVENALSGSENTSGSGFAVSVFEAAQCILPVSPDSHSGAGDFLFARGSADENADPEPLSQAELESLLKVAVSAWSDYAKANGLSDILSQLQATVTDLPDGALGEARDGMIYIDATAAGYGWFVDSTPGESSEFAFTLADGREVAISSSRAYGRMDLRTVLVHEVGHLLGLGHDSSFAVMAENLEAGVRVSAISISDANSASSGNGYLSQPSPGILSGLGDSNAIHFEVVDDDSNLVPDVIVTNADSGNATYNDVSIIRGSISNPGDTVEISIAANVDWELSATPNSGTFTIFGFSGIFFEEVNNLTGSSADDTFEFDNGWNIDGTVDGGTGTNKIEVTENGDMTLTDTGITIAGDPATLANIQQAELTGGSSTTSVDVTGFSGSVYIQKTGFPTWEEEGPGGIGGTSLESPIAGAANAIAPHPFDANVIYIGTVGGGIWKGNGTNWVPLTDGFPNIGISTLAISPLDRLGAPVDGDTPDEDLVLIAGTGQTSSSYSGSVPSGLLFSSDGGQSWIVLGETRLRNLGVTKVVPTSLTSGDNQIIYFSTLDLDQDSNNVVDDTGGVFKLLVDIDTTVTSTKLDSSTLTKISGAGGELGLPAGHYTDLAFDPGVSTGTPKPARLFAVNPEQGIFEWDNLTTLWAEINGGIETGTDTDGDGIDNFFEPVVRIKLALFNSTGSTEPVVYAGVIGPNTNGNSGSGLTHIFKNVDNGISNWTTIPIPTSSDGTPASTSGLHPGGQGDLHFSIAVDPTNANSIYVGGDSQPTLTNNSVGLTEWVARLFRYDGSAWEQIVGNTVNNTAPHADSRFITFDSTNNRLLEANDGGIYALADPRNNIGAVTRQWTSLVGDLRVTEVSSAAYDPISKVYTVGTQDNGSARQSAAAHDGVDDNAANGADELAERVTGWTAIHGGDGATQDITTFDSSGGGGAHDQSVRYSISNNMNFIYRGVYDSSGNLVGTQDQVDLARRAGGAFFSGITNRLDRRFDGFWPVALATNKFDDTRVVIGMFGIYESSDRLDTVTRVHRGVQNQNANGSYPFSRSSVSSLTYGGTTGGVDNANLIVASIGNQILYREAVGNRFTAKALPAPASVVDFVVDPDNWKTVYAANRAFVFKTADITVANPVWTRISAQITDIRSIEYVSDPGGDFLLVGSADGVQKLNDPDTFTSLDLAAWVDFGAGLPGAPVSDVRYYDIDNSDSLTDADIIMAATMGRGVWSITNLSSDILTEFIPQFIGTTGDDQYKIILNETNDELVEVYNLDISTTEPIFTHEVSSISSIIFSLRGGDDTLTLDHSNGAISISNGIYLDGGSDTSGTGGTGDTVILAGDDIDDKFEGTVDGHDYYTVFDPDGGRQVLIYDNVENVDDSAFLGWGNPWNSIKMAFYWLGELLGLKDTDVPVFGSSLDSALSGTIPEQRPPKGDPTRAPSVPQIEQASQNSNTDSIFQRLIETGPGGFQISDIGSTLLDSGAELESALDGLDDTPGNVHFTDGGTFYELDIQILRTLRGQANLDFDFDVGVGQVDISGFIEVSADLALNIIVGVDANGFYIRTRDGDGSAPPELSLSNIVVSISDDAKAAGEFGFLEVALTEIDLAVHSAVALTADITTGGGSDSQLRVQDFFSDPLGLFSISLSGDGDAGTDDLFLTGTFVVSPYLPGDPESAFELGTIKVDLKWPDITDITNVNVSATPGFSGGDQLMKFLDIDPDVLLAQVESVRDNLDGFGVEIPYVDQALDTFTDLVSGFNDYVIAPMNSDPQFSGGGASVGSVQDLADKTAESLGSSITDLGFNFDIPTAELTYTIDLSHTVSGTEALDFRLDALNGLLSGDFDYSATGNLVLTIGIDLDELVSGDAGDAIFLRDVSAGGSAEFTLNNLTATFGANGLNFGITNGDITANASLSFDLAPSDDHITINELVAAVTSDPLSLVENTAFTAGASLTNLAIDLGGFVHLSGNFNIATDTLAEVTVLDSPSSPEVLNDLPVTTIGAESGTIFVGANYGTDSQIGFSSTISSLAVVIIEQSGSSRTWQAAKGTIASASLAGVTDLTVLAEDLTLDYNGRALDDSYVDFTQIDADGDSTPEGSFTVMAGATPVVFSYSAPITKVTADASLDLFGFVVGTATFEITSTVMDVVTGNASIPGSGAVLPDVDVAGTLMNASVLTATVSNLNLFGGIGASITTGDPTMISDDSLDLSSAVGFSIVGGTASFALVKPADVTAGDLRSYLGFEADLAQAQLQGVDGLEFFASGSFKLNLAKDTSGNTISVRVDWVTATNETNDPDHIIPDFTLGSALELGITGSAVIDVGTGVFVATITGVNLNIGSMTVQDGTTSIGTADIISFSGTANVFAGVGGDLIAGNTDVQDGSFGFSADAVGISLVLATDASGNSYTGAEVVLGSASLVGVDGLEFFAGGTLKLNSAVDSAGVDLSTRLDWSKATGFDTDPTNYDPDNLLADLDIGSAIELQITEGSAAIDVGSGVFVATVTGVNLTLGSMTVQDGTTNIGTADIISFSGTANVFAGVGGDLISGNTDVQDGDFGFSAEAVGISLVLATDASGNSYTGAEVVLGSASLVGVDGLEFFAGGTLKLNSAVDSTGVDITPRMDWSEATGVDTSEANYDPDNLLADLDIGEAIELQISEGFAAIDVGSGVFVATINNVTLSIGTMNVTDGSTTLNDASVIAFSGTADVFAGVGGSLTAGHDDVNNGTIGFAVDGVDIDLVLASLPTGESYTGLEVGLASAELIGVTGLEFYAGGDLKVNSASGTGGPITPRMNWTDATNSTNDPFDVLGTLDISSDIQLQIANGSVALNVGGGVLAATVSGVTLNLGTTTVTDGATTLTDADIISFSGTANVFAGVGASLNEAHDDVVDGTLGFSVDGVDLALVIATGSLTDPVTDNQGDTYMGVQVDLSAAKLVGITGLDLYAAGTVKLNSATDALTSMPLTPRMDWSLATDDAGYDSAMLLADMDVGSAIELQVSGSAAVNAFGVFVAKVDNFELTIATADVTTGNPAIGTLADANLLSVSLGGLDAFAGVGASFDQETITDVSTLNLVTEGALGFNVDDGSVAMSIVKPNVPVGDQTSYTGLEVSFAMAELVGLPDAFKFYAAGSVLMNKAVDSAGVVASEKVNWATATNSVNDPGDLIPAFSPELTENIDLQISGSAALDVFGVVVGTANFSMTQGTDTIGTGNSAIGDSGTLTDAGVMVISLSNINLFAGIGASLDQDPVDDLTTIGIDTTGALGFSVVGGTVDVAIVKPADAGPSNLASWMGLEIGLEGATLVGIDGLTLIASGSVLLNKATDSAGNPGSDKIDWANATSTLLPEFSDLLTSGIDLSIQGSASIDIFGFVVGTATFSMTQGTTDVDTNNTAIPGSGGSLSTPTETDEAGILKNAPTMAISLSNVNLFAGIGAALNDNGTLTPTDDTIDVGSAIGFSIDGGSVDLALVKPAGLGVGDLTSYTGMAISLDGASLEGVDGLTLKASGSVLINKATNAAGEEVTDRIDWANATDSEGILPTFPAGLTKDVALVISADVTVNLFGFVVGSAGLTMSRTTVDVDANGNGVFSPSTDKDLEDATMLSIGLTITDVFVGIGADLDDTDTLVVPDDAIGFRVSEGEIGFVSIKANQTIIPGDTRSYSAISSTLGQAAFEGIPGIDISANNVKVEVNSATGVVPGTTTPAEAINWTTSVGEGDAGDGSFTAAAVEVEFTSADPVAIELEGAFTGISGLLRLDIAGAVQIYAGFEMVIQTVDVDIDGNGTIDPNLDYDDAQLLTIGLQLVEWDKTADLDGDGTPDTTDDHDLYTSLLPATASDGDVLPGLFIGVPGGPGFAVSSGEVAIATVKVNPDPLKNPSAFNRTYTAMKLNVREAGLVGLPDDLVITAVELYYESNTSSAPDPANPGPTDPAATQPGLDWTDGADGQVDLQSGDDSFDADLILVNGTALGFTGELFRIGGSIKINIKGFVLAAGSFEYEKLSNLGGYSDGSGTTLSPTANGQRITLSGLYLFVGVNGDFAEDDDGNVTGLDTSDAIGFSVSGGSLELIMVTETDGDMRSWMGVAAHVDAMQIHGLPDTFELEVLELDVLFNSPAAFDMSRLNWSQLATLTDDPFSLSGTRLADMDQNTVLDVEGQLYLNISGFVILSAHFSIAQRTLDSTANHNGLALDGGNLLVISLSDVYLFAGVDGVINKDGYDDVADFEQDLEDNNALGFLIGGAYLDLAMLSVGTGATAKKWMGIAAGLDLMTFTGLDPSVFSLRLMNMKLWMNMPAADTTKIDWTYLADQSADWALDGTALAELDNTVEFLFFGSFFLNISSFVWVSGTIALQKQELFAKPIGSTESVKMSVLSIGMYELRVFAGIGNADSDGDYMVDDVEDLEVNATGVALSVEKMALVLMKPVVAPEATPSTKKYFSLKGTGTADLVGIDGVTLSGRLTIEINQGKDSGNLVDGLTPSIDYAASAAADPSGYGSSEGLEVITGPTIDDTELVSFTEDQLLRASGYVVLSLSEFVHVSGQFAFEKSGDPVTVTTVNPDASTGTKEVNVMTIGASGVNAFVGIGGPYFVDSNEDGIIDSNDTPEEDGAMGFVLSDLEFAMAMMKADRAPTAGQGLGLTR